MKKVFVVCVALVVFSGLALASVGPNITYNGNAFLSDVGDTMGTDLPMFDSTLGTLTGVQITLDLGVTPYAAIFNNSAAVAYFSSSASIEASYNPALTLTFSHGSDGWMVAAPTVTTGKIYGSGQPIAPFSFLTFSPNSAPVSLAVSALMANLAEYIGMGTLSFGTGGQPALAASNINYPPLASTKGAYVSGTASVTYEYVPEPATLAMLGLGGLLLRKRK